MNSLFVSAKVAGLALYGEPNDGSNWEVRGSGLVWFNETSIVHVNLTDLPLALCTNCGHHVDRHESLDASLWHCSILHCGCSLLDESDYSDCKDGAHPYADDYEFQFNPSDNTGVDVACDEIRDLAPDTDGNIYLYYPECGIRVIHTRNDWKE